MKNRFFSMKKRIFNAKTRLPNEKPLVSHQSADAEVQTVAGMPTKLLLPQEIDAILSPRQFWTDSIKWNVGEVQAILMKTPG